METYFGIKYEFSRDAVIGAIDHAVKSGYTDYLCVADGVVLDNAVRNSDYMRVVNGGMFSICDSSWVTLYIRWIHGQEYTPYYGCQIFNDIIASRKYRMIFIGSDCETLYALQNELMSINSAVSDMQFVELPYADVSDFDYDAIAKIINTDGADIIWVSLGAPKQERFMAMLKPHLHRGVIISVGAAFRFYSKIGVCRAPDWMVKNHLEFVHRLFKEPRKQLRRCLSILGTLPRILYNEWSAKSSNVDAIVDTSLYSRHQ